MVRIKIKRDGHNVILDCTKSYPEGKKFQLVIGDRTKELFEKPARWDVDMSAVYSCIYTYLKEGKELPEETVAAWG